MNKKIIVTHKWPDFDAITSVWLIKRYYPNFKTAKVEFVPAGSTYENKPPDADPNIIHVDTGLGRFDHHQDKIKTSASEKIFKFLKQNKLLPKKEIEPVKRIVALVTFIDNFQEVTLPNPTNDIYELTLPQIIEGLNLYFQNDEEVVKLCENLLTSFLIVMKNKIRAEKEIKNDALNFNSLWGKSLAVISENEETVRLALKMGYKLVVRKDPKKGYLRIKANPGSKIDLTPIYKKLKELDSQATWFLHKSKKMLINGSAKNPRAKVTKLSLDKIVKILKA